MAVLTKKEILAGLKKLGLNSASELDSYFKEYSEYLTLQDIQIDPPRTYRKKTKSSYTGRHVSADPSAASIANSFISVVDPMAFVKTKASRRMK